MSLAQVAYSFRGGHHAQKSNPVRAGPLQRCNRGSSASSSRKHRVQQKKITLSRVSRDLAVIVHRLQGVVVPVQANVPDPGRWHQTKNSLHHPKTSAQNRDKSQLLSADVPTRRPFQWGIYISRLERELAGCLVSHEHCDLINELLEMLGLGLLIAENR